MCCCRENGKLAPLVFQVPTLVMKEQPVAGTGTPSREYQRQEKRGRRSGGWRWSLTRSDARKNPLLYIYIYYTPVGIAIRSWKASTTAGYATHLRGLADVEDELGEEGWLPEILSRRLARHLQHGGSASAARGIISAVRACEDLQWIAGVVQPLHWRLAKAGAQSGAQEYASPVMLRHLVEAAKSADDRAVVAMALVSYVCFLRVAEAASVRAGDVRDSCYVVFWNSKTGDEGWQQRPVPEWLRPYVEWLLEWAEDRGLARDDLL